jgi:hypothetical protein
MAKAPSKRDDGSRNWPAFHYELEMQRLFAGDPMVRHMVDVVPKTGAEEPPLMILEPYHETLWDARKTRPFTTKEIKWIMHGVLLGIMTVHHKGLVYTGALEIVRFVLEYLLISLFFPLDLRMENVGLSWFDGEKPNEDPRQIKVRLADLLPGTENDKAPESYYPLYGNGIQMTKVTMNSQRARYPTDHGIGVPQP